MNWLTFSLSPLTCSNADSTGRSERDVAASPGPNSAPAVTIYAAIPVWLLPLLLHFLPYFH